MSPEAAYFIAFLKSMGVVPPHAEFEQVSDTVVRRIS